jgi:hypothetical protein
MEDIQFDHDTNKIWKYLLIAIVALGILYAITGSDSLLLPLAPLALGVVLSPSLWGKLGIGAAGRFSGRVNERALGQWQGNYYSWNDRQIRVMERRNAVWVVSEDVLRAAGVKPDAAMFKMLESGRPGYGAIPGTDYMGFSEKGVLEFLRERQRDNPEIIKLVLWFERDVFFPIRQKRQNI